MADNVQQQQVTPTAPIVASAEPRKPLTADEKKQLHAELRERMKRSRLEATGPKHLHLSWARKDDDEELARLEYLGYTIVRDPESDPKKRKFNASGHRQDGTFIVGDVILVCCPIETFEFLQEENERVARAQIEGVDDEFRSKAAESNVPTFKVDKEKK